MIKTLVSSLALGVAALPLAAAPLLPGATAPAAAAGTAPLRVASFNIQNVSLDKTDGLQRPWAQRRDTIIRQVLREGIHVLGVQEAQPSRFFRDRLVAGDTQYLDLKNGLNADGTHHYRLANRLSFNCENSKTSNDCVYQYRGASQGERIIYDSDYVSLVSTGSVKYDSQPDDHPMYLAWARMKVKANGAQFLFTTTHLSTGEDGPRKLQWKQMISVINGLKGSDPVISVGDFNTQKFAPLAEDMIPAMRAAGYGDVLNQQYRVNPIARPRAESTVNGWVNSLNKLQPSVRDFSYWDQRRKTGNSIDWIFADNDLPVRDYEVVVDYDYESLDVNGVLPSDHNMVRATLAMG